MKIFVNTRPNHATLPQLDVPSVHLPLLEIKVLDRLDDTQKQDMMRFIKGDIDTVVAVSVQAVRCAIDFLKQHHIHHAHDLPHRPTMIAVGESTKQALAQFGFEVITPSQYDLAMSNEGMLQIPTLSKMTQGDTLMIWRGMGGRRLLHDTLLSRGVDIRPVIFYERRMPTDIQRRFAQFYDTLPADTRLIVLISSGMSLQTWVKFDRQQHHTTFLALGDRLTVLTRHYYPKHPIICIDTLDDKIINRMCNLNLPDT